ncbi:MAG: hypothetical protein ACMUHX_06090, partial [bacterium]
MKTKRLKNLLVISIVFTIMVMISMNVDAQIVNPIDFSTAFYYPVWSLVGTGSPWWATAITKQTIPPLS